MVKKGKAKDFGAVSKFKGLRHANVMQGGDLVRIVAEIKPPVGKAFSQTYDLDPDGAFKLATGRDPKAYYRSIDTLLERYKARVERLGAEIEALKETNKYNEMAAVETKAAYDELFKIYEDLTKKTKDLPKVDDGKTLDPDLEKRLSKTIGDLFGGEMTGLVLIEYLPIAVACTKGGMSEKEVTEFLEKENGFRRAYKELEGKVTLVKADGARETLDRLIGYARARDIITDAQKAEIEVARAKNDLSGVEAFVDTLKTVLTEYELATRGLADEAKTKGDAAGRLTLELADKNRILSEKEKAILEFSRVIEDASKGDAAVMRDAIHKAEGVAMHFAGNISRLFDSLEELRSDLTGKLDAATRDATNARVDLATVQAEVTSRDATIVDRDNRINGLDFDLRTERDRVLDLERNLATEKASKPKVLPWAIAAGAAGLLAGMGMMYLFGGSSEESNGKKMIVTHPGSNNPTINIDGTQLEDLLRQGIEVKGKVRRTVEIVPK